MGRVPRRGALIGGALLAVALAGVIAWTQIERIGCEAQMTGDGPSRFGSNCGYQLDNTPEEFRYAVASGLETVLYLSGGTESAPESIRIVRDGSVVIERETRRLTGDTIDVCRNQPPRDPRWWSATISDEVAAAIRQRNTSLYRVEGLVGGQWTLLRLHNSGCRWISS
jgi:hypothetical protein